MATMAGRVLLRTVSNAKNCTLSTSVRAVSSSAVCQSKDYVGPNVSKVTHTGQVWDEDDYRNVRFMNKDKMVNQQWAIDLIAADPVVVVNGNHVWSHSCGALGHPKVYINLDKPEMGVCGYSGRKFIQKKFYNEAEHGPSITHEEYLKQMKGDSR